MLPITVSVFLFISHLQRVYIPLKPTQGHIYTIQKSVFVFKNQPTLKTLTKRYMYQKSRRSFQNFKRCMTSLAKTSSLDLISVIVVLHLESNEQI